MVTLLGLGALAFGLRSYLLHQEAAARLASRSLGDDDGEDDEAELQLPPTARRRSILRRRRWTPWGVGLSGIGALALLVGLDWPLAFAVGAVMGVLTELLESFLHGRREARLEAQLADVVDLLVASLRAGSGLLEALDMAALETRRPLGPQLRAMVERIRLGDDPQETFRDLAERIPLEPYALFAATLSVNWEVGGSMAETLAEVAQTVRERTELERKVRAQATQSRASVVSILALCYLIGFSSWLSDAARLEGFIASTAGSLLVAATILLQAGGLLWSASMSKIEV